MKEFTLNRMPEADVDGYKAYGRVPPDEESEDAVPWVMVPDAVWEAYGNAAQINVQLTR